MTNRRNDLDNPFGNVVPGVQPPNNGQGPRDIPQQNPAPTFTQRVGENIASWKENSAHRMQICNTCPDYAPPRCKLCGCFMTAKTKIPQAKCPAGKW